MEESSAPADVTTLPLKFLRTTFNARVPELDSKNGVVCLLYSSEKVIVPARGTIVVPTGIALDIPFGFVAKISMIPNEVWHNDFFATHKIIYHDDHREIKPTVLSLESMPIVIERHHPIAQLTVERMYGLELQEVHTLW